MSLFTRLLRDTGARLASAGLAARLMPGGRDEECQKRLLQRLLTRFSRSDYGRAHRLEPGLSYGDFVKRAPVMTWEALEPILGTHEHGGGYLLSSEPCLTTLSCLDAPGEALRRLPLTRTGLEQFQAAWNTALFAGSLHKIPCTHLNRHSLVLGLPDDPPIPAGDLMPLDLRGLVARCSQRLHRTSPLSLTGHTPSSAEPPQVLLAGDPLWLATLFPEPLISTDAGSMQAKRPAWTAELSLMLGYRQSMRGMSDQARLLLGHPVRIHEVFTTEMGVLATQTGDPDEGLRLLTDQGVFMEFVPVGDYDPMRPDLMGQKALGIGQLTQGASYVLLLSNHSGLCRHDSGERVRCLSTSPVRIRPEGRQSRVLSIAGEQLTEADIFDAAAHCCDRHDWAIVHLHVAPLPAREGAPASHEWWIELKPGSRQTPTGPAISELLDAQLGREAGAYGALRRNGILAAPVVRLVIPGVFKNWLQTNGRLDSRFSLPRCLPDRRIADALSALAKFSD